LFYYICTNFHQINIIISSSEILISLWLYKKQINFLLWVHLFHFFIVRSLIKYLDCYFRSVFTLFFIFYDKSIFYLLNISLNLLEREFKINRKIVSFLSVWELFLWHTILVIKMNKFNQSHHWISFNTRTTRFHRMNYAHIVYRIYLQHYPDFLDSEKKRGKKREDGSTDYRRFEHGSSLKRRDDSN